MTDPLADWMEHDSKREIDVAEEALFPSVRMQHKAKPSLEYWVAKSMPASNEHRPKDCLSRGENLVTKTLGADDWAADEEEKKLGTVLVFFSYYSLEIS